MAHIVDTTIGRLAQATQPTYKIITGTTSATIGTITTHAHGLTDDIGTALAPTNAILTVNQTASTRIADATTAATPSATADVASALATGTYYAVYTWYNTFGETKPSAVSASQAVTFNTTKLTVTCPSLPATATGAKAYISLAATGPFIYAASAASNVVQCDAALGSAALTVPTINTTSPDTPRIAAAADSTNISVQADQASVPFVALVTA